MPNEILHTERLLLRPPAKEDIPRFMPLLADRDIARNLSSVPHPYTENDARAFIARAAQKRAEGAAFSFALLGKADETFIGAVGVHPERNWEFGYWIGKPYWGQGYATEAARRVVAFAFDELGAECLNAGWFHDNPASGRVLMKVGCEPCGSEQHVSLARAEAEPCHRMLLTRARWREITARA